MRKEISSSFVVVVPHIDESLSFKNFTDVKDIVKDISLRKCLEVAKDHNEDLVIAADTVVVLGNEIIGKPKDKEDAFKILKGEAGTHFDPLLIEVLLRHKDKYVAYLNERNSQK